MECKDLIKTFEKVGGRLLCIYNTKSMNLYLLNKSCTITHDDKFELNELLSKYGYSGYVDEILFELEKNKNSMKDNHGVFVIDTPKK